MFTGPAVATLPGVPAGARLGLHSGWRSTFLAVSAIGVLATVIIATPCDGNGPLCNARNHPDAEQVKRLIDICPGADVNRFYHADVHSGGVPQAFPGAALEGWRESVAAPCDTGAVTPPYPFCTYRNDSFGWHNPPTACPICYIRPFPQPACNPMDTSLSGWTAVVTGSTAGIGNAIAEELGRVVAFVASPGRASVVNGAAIRAGGGVLLSAF